MTKQNRERAYKQFRDCETNYEARPDLDKGMTATKDMRARAKIGADALLLRNPELEVKEEPKSSKRK